MMNDAVAIVAAARTPMGAFQGELKGLTASALGGVALQAAVQRAGIAPTQVQEVLMGCVLPAGQGQAPARQAALAAGLPLSTGCTTLNKMCGSGMKALMQAYDALCAGSAEVVVAGGMESMSNAPYLLPKARAGLRMGHGVVLDHMFFDGLEDAYDKNADGSGKLMGVFADQCAAHYQFSREDQDAYALESLKRALAANSDGSFEAEIAPVTLKEGSVISRDESPFKARADKIPALKPAFSKNGTVTAANASSISDGAAALVLMRESHARAQGLKPLARLVAHSTHAQEPGWFTTAPVGAIQKLYEKTGWNTAQVDLFEINEAFAVVTLAAMREHGIAHERVNVHGGACALGHPIGASGARIVVTLLHAMKKRQARRGVASLCIGGGEATAVALEMLDAH
jgi:acetyl-CoA C-acetyltransferase